VADLVTKASVPCAPTACSACPWRKSNQGKPHPHNWYAQSNLDRLWRGLRTGEAPGMSCHPTDARNEVPDGHRAAPDGSIMHECAGSLLLVQRELTEAQRVGVESYPKRMPFLSKSGLRWWGLARVVFAGTPVGGPPMPVIDEDPDIYYAPIARARTRPCSSSSPASAGSSTACAMPTSTPPTAPSTTDRAPGSA